MLAWWTADHVTGPAPVGPQPTGSAVDRRRAARGHVASATSTPRISRPRRAAAYVLDERRQLEERLDRGGRGCCDASIAAALAGARARELDRRGAVQLGRPGERPAVHDRGRRLALADGRPHRHERPTARRAPYLATFFTELNLTELDEFRRLRRRARRDPARQRQLRPRPRHDRRALRLADRPSRDFLPAKEWTDLTMSLVAAGLQAVAPYRPPGRARALLAGRCARHGVPARDRAARRSRGRHHLRRLGACRACSPTRATLYLASLRDDGRHGRAIEPASAPQPINRARHLRRRARGRAVGRARLLSHQPPTHDTMFTARSPATGSRATPGRTRCRSGPGREPSAPPAHQRASLVTRRSRRAGPLPRAAARRGALRRHRGA